MLARNPVLVGVANSAPVLRSSVESLLTDTFVGITIAIIVFVVYYFLVLRTAGGGGGHQRNS